MLSGVLAMYAGETSSFETNLTNPVYTVVGNSSDMVGLNISIENTTISISTASNFGPDNFTLIFFDNTTKEVEKIIYRGGGGSRTKYVDRNVTVYVPEYINSTIVETIELTNDSPVPVVADDGLGWGTIFLIIILTIIITIIVIATIMYFI